MSGQAVGPFLYHLKQELNVHIRKIVKEFGSFCPTESKLLLDSQTMQRQLVAMIPGAFAKSSGRAMSTENHKQRIVSAETQGKAIKPNEPARAVLEARNAGQLMTASNVNSIQGTPNVEQRSIESNASGSVSEKPRAFSTGK